MSALTSTQLMIFGAATIILQRFAVPISFPVGESIDTVSVPVSLIVISGLWAYVLYCGMVKVSAAGLLVWISLMAVGLASYLANLGHLESSVMSLAFLLVCYSPIMVTTIGSGRIDIGRSYALGFILATLAGSILAIAQAALQYGGSSIWDPVSNLPQQFQVEGFNNLYLLDQGQEAYGLIFKPNGVFFLEPSFLSLFSCLAIVFVLGDPTLVTRPGRRASAIALLIAGFMLSISTSGLPVLALALLPATPRLLRYPGMVLAGILALWLAYRLDLLDPLIAKAFEGFSAQSSTGLRTVVPYRLLLPYVNDALLLGHGPGSATDIVGRLAIPGLQVPTLLKATLEYGILGLGVFVAATAMVMRWSMAPASVVSAALAAWLIPAEALLNPVLVALVFFAIRNWKVREDMTPRGDDFTQRIQQREGALGVPIHRRPPGR